MNRFCLTLLCALALPACLPGSLRAGETPPWAEERTLDRFADLLKRSPFTLPTAEESSPLSDRFSLTGAFVLDGEQVVFVLDSTTQARSKVTAQPNDLGLRLIEYLPDTDPRKMRATVRLGEQTATLSFKEATAPAAPNLAQGPAGNPAASPGTVHVSAGQPPAPNVTVMNTGGQRPQTPRPTVPRRVVRRTIITGNPAPSQ